MGNWQLHEARNRLGELVRRALRDGPQRVTRRRKPAVIVVAESPWNEITQKIPSFGRLLAERPLEAEDCPGGGRRGCWRNLSVDPCTIDGRDSSREAGQVVGEVDQGSWLSVQMW